MTTRITQSPAGILIAAGVFIGLCFNESLATEKKCKNNSEVAPTKRVCVAWDRGAAPIEGYHFTASYTCGGCSDDPEVALLAGDDTWVVYSEVISTAAPANLGALTTSDNENYIVKLANGAGAGAADVGSMVLEPSGSHHSSIAAGSRISGDLNGNLTLKESGGSGGTLSLTIDGSANGDITVANISYLSIGEDLGGKLVADDITGSMTIGDDMLDEIELDELTGALTITGNVDSLLWLTESSSGSITTGPVNGVVTLNQSDEAVYSGTATFDSVPSGGLVMTLLGGLSGTIHVTGNVGGTVAAAALSPNTGLLTGGSIQVDGDVSGSIVVQFDSEGDIEIGGALTSTGNVLVLGDLAGDVDITGDVDGNIIANYLGDAEGDITGDVTIVGDFNGEICGDNLSPLAALPGNLSIENFGDGGTICGGAPGCGDGTITGSDPADGTRDSRQPHPVNDCSLAARQGIGSEDEPIEITLSESGAGGVLCWQLCETGIEAVDTGESCPSLSANFVKSVTETSTGVYELVLDRPISAGEWTTISYLGDDSYVTYASLPADAEADGQSASDDYTAIINYLNEVATPPYGVYSTDMDHSEAFNSSDALRLLDLLNGAGKFTSWYGATLPTNTCP